MEFAEADAQRARRIEGIRYEADLARRRFFEVDPANRLVAAALEADWNERLRVLEEACREREARAAARDSELSERQVESIRELTRDFEWVWNAPETGNTDRKRLLGLLIEDATLTRDGYEVTVELRMRGGRSLALKKLNLPRPIAQIRKTPPETITALDQLLTPMKPPPESSTGWGTGTGRASPVRGRTRTRPGDALLAALHRPLAG